MTIVAIVVTYNGSKWIEKCFGSLTSCGIPLKIFAIDNASTDDTVSLIKNQFPRVEVIETGANLGFGQANNVGLQKALEVNADYVFLLNQDAWIEKDTIEQLVNEAQANEAYGILSPFHLNWTGDKVDPYFLSMVTPSASPDFLSDSFLNKQKKIYSLEFIHAACWLISRDCIESTGGFDPLFYHYGEDNDYVNRATALNFKTGIVPHTYVYHSGFFDLSKPLGYNLKLRIIHSLLELKNMKSSLAGNYFFYLKNRWDRATTLFFAKRFKNSFRELQLGFIMCKYLFKVKESRKKTKFNKAFL